jgi:hypothetical protein
MKTPMTVINSITTLLQPYGIDFGEMWRSYQSKRTEPVDSDEWLSLKEAAAFAKVSVWTIRRWCRKGVVSKKTSRARCGRILISKVSLEKFIDGLIDPNQKAI